MHWNESWAILEGSLVHFLMASSSVGEEALLWPRSDTVDQLMQEVERWGVVLVQGPVGMGKSSLARLVQLQASKAGWGTHLIHASRYSLEFGDLPIDWSSLRSPECSMLIIIDEVSPPLPIRSSSQQNSGPGFL
jgi:replication-associated recombination protein RarA